jgi:hypothetical protein
VFGLVGGPRYVLQDVVVAILQQELGDVTHYYYYDAMMMMMTMTMRTKREEEGGGGSAPVQVATFTVNFWSGLDGHCCFGSPLPNHHQPPRNEHSHGTKRGKAMLPTFD